MIPQSILINAPSVDFGTLINAADQALGRSICGGVDNTAKKLSDAERFLSLLNTLKNEQAPVCLPPTLLTHVSFSILTVAQDLDMLDILESCSGMPFTQTDTTVRGVVLVVISGTLQQWRDAIVTGCQAQQQVNVRSGFNQIHNLFVGAGLGACWNDFEQKPLDQGYTLLEYKP